MNSASGCAWPEAILERGGPCNGPSPAGACREATHRAQVQAVIEQHFHEQGRADRPTARRVARLNDNELQCDCINTSNNVPLVGVS